MQVSHSQLSQVQRKPNFDKNLQSQWSMKYRSRVSGQYACLKEFVKDNNYARGFTFTAIIGVEKT